MAKRNRFFKRWRHLIGALGIGIAVLIGIAIINSWLYAGAYNLLVLIVLAALCYGIELYQYHMTCYGSRKKDQRGASSQTAAQLEAAKEQERELERQRVRKQILYFYFVPVGILILFLIQKPSITYEEGRELAAQEWQMELYPAEERVCVISNRSESEDTETVVTVYAYSDTEGGTPVCYVLPETGELLAEGQP